MILRRVGKFARTQWRGEGVENVKSNIDSAAEYEEESKKDNMS